MKEYTNRLLFEALNLVSEIYTASMYDEVYDLFRIKDITDSLSQGQYDSKIWAVNELLPLIKQHDLNSNIEDNYNSCFVIGGWYGLFSYLLAQKGFTKTIKNIDLDPRCEEFGYKLRQHDNVFFKTDDGIDSFHTFNYDNKVVVCTACEHIDPDELEFMIRQKKPGMLMCLQSNDYFEIDSHINCKKSLDDFIKSLPLKEILYSGEKPWKNEYTRFMVIGK